MKLVTRHRLIKGRLVNRSFRLSKDYVCTSCSNPCRYQGNYSFNRSCFMWGMGLVLYEISNEI